MSTPKEGPSLLDGLGDFTTTTRVLPIALLAALIGAISAFVAVALLRMIAFFTNLFFFQRLAFTSVTPAGSHLGWAVVLVPVAGALLIGLMARYGSEKNRGHGIPEVIEANLAGGVLPLEAIVPKWLKVAANKPSVFRPRTTSNAAVAEAERVD